MDITAKLAALSLPADAALNVWGLLHELRYEADRDLAHAENDLRNAVELDRVHQGLATSERLCLQRELADLRYEADYDAAHIENARIDEIAELNKVRSQLATTEQALERLNDDYIAQGRALATWRQVAIDRTCAYPGDDANEHDHAECVDALATA